MSRLRSSSPSLSIRVLTVLAAGLMAHLPGGLSAEDPSFLTIARSYFDRAVASISTRFGSEDDSHPKAGDADSIAKDAALDQVIRSIFLEEKGYHFTQSRWGAKPVPYQIDGFSVTEFPDGTLNTTDHKEGIDQRVTYELKVKAFRLYDEVAGWGKWNKGNPPHLDNVTLVRQDGVWKVAISPARSYSLK